MTNLNAVTRPWWKLFPLSQIVKIDEGLEDEVVNAIANKVKVRLEKSFLETNKGLIMPMFKVDTVCFPTIVPPRLWLCNQRVAASLWSPIWNIVKPSLARLTLIVPTAVISEALEGRQHRIRNTDLNLIPRDSTWPLLEILPSIRFEVKKFKIIGQKGRGDGSCESGCRSYRSFTLSPQELPNVPFWDGAEPEMEKYDLLYHNSGSNKNI